MTRNLHAALRLLTSVFPLTVVHAQIIDTPDGEVAGIPANYTEAEVGSYTLPDPLLLANGDRVADAATWNERRRPEIHRLLEENQFGRAPGRPESMRFEVFDKGTSAFDGLALRKQVTIHFGEETDHFLDLLVYLPADADGPVPLLLEFGWGGNNQAVDDPGVKIGRVWDRGKKTRVKADGPRRFGKAMDLKPILSRGYGFALFNYTDIDPDAPDAIAHGVRQAFLEDGENQPAADGWGSIAAWAWGAGRVLDYLETDPGVDASRVAITGASRLGKTTLWTAANDPRFACVIASISGEGGAALSRRDYGETVAHLVADSRYAYQFARNYRKWAGRMKEAPFDSHFLIALIAPRPLLLQTGNTDKWSDPYGEFLAAKAATPVYELLGAKGIKEYSLPPAGEPMMNTLGYLMHDGGHGVLPEDRAVFLDFLDLHLKPSP